MNSDSIKLNLLFVKGIFLSLIIFISFELIKIGFIEIRNVLLDRKIEFLNYIWLSPIYRTTLSNELNSFIGESVFISYYLLAVGTIFIVAFITTIISNLMISLKSVWQAEDISSVITLVQPLICWILAYYTVHILNGHWPIENFLNNTLPLSEFTILTAFIFKLSFVCGIVYSVKSLYHALYTNIVELPVYMNKKVWGN